jgi:hypothetical protein
MVDNVVVKIRTILSQTLKLHKGGSLLSTFYVGWSSKLTHSIIMTASKEEE